MHPHTISPVPHNSKPHTSFVLLFFISQCLYSSSSYLIIHCLFGFWTSPTTSLSLLYKRITSLCPSELHVPIAFSHLVAHLLHQHHLHGTFQEPSERLEHMRTPCQQHHLWISTDRKSSNWRLSQISPSTAPTFPHTATISPWCTEYQQLVIHSISKHRQSVQFAQ